jgi:MSHA biogenesis protein MshN
MLKDLEKRKEPAAEGDLPVEVHASEEEPSYGGSGLRLLVLVLLALGLIYWFWFGPGQVRKVPMVANPPPLTTTDSLGNSAPQGEPLKTIKLESPLPTEVIHREVREEREIAESPEVLTPTPLPVKEEPNARASSRERLTPTAVPQPLSQGEKRPANPRVSPNKAEQDLQRSVQNLLNARKAATPGKPSRASSAPPAQSLQSRLRLVRAQIAAGQWQSARALLEEIPSAQDDADFRRLRVEVLLHEGDLKNAELLLGGLESDSENIEQLGLMASLRQRQGRYGDALHLYERAVNMQPEQSRWWVGLGICLEAQQRRADALLSYRRALVLGGQGETVRAWLQTRLQALSPRP